MKKLQLKLFILFNSLGVVAIVVLGAIELATKQNIYYLLWFIPLCLIFISIGVLVGFRSTQDNKKKKAQV